MCGGLIALVAMIGLCLLGAPGVAHAGYIVHVFATLGDPISGETAVHIDSSYYDEQPTKAEIITDCYDVGLTDASLYVTVETDDYGNPTGVVDSGELGYNVRAKAPWKHVSTVPVLPPACECSSDCTCGCQGPVVQNCAGDVKFHADLQLGKGLVDLAPMRGPNTPTMLGGKLNVGADVGGRLQLTASYRMPFYDGHYWDRAFTKFEAGASLALKPRGPSVFANYERNPTTGQEWGWFGVRFPLLR